jgi:hypothetical protein
MFTYMEFFATPFIFSCWFCDNGMFLSILAFEQFLNCSNCLKSFYREDATRSGLDLRDPGPPTLLFLITPTSSKTYLSLVSWVDIFWSS